MFYRKKLVYLSIFFCNSLMSGPLTLAARKALAQDIMATPVANLTNDQLTGIDQAFSQENDETCRWFDAHKNGLQSKLQEVSSDAQVKIMGSRRWKTNHILSDIDAVIVTDASNQDSVMDSLQNHYAQLYPGIKPFRTVTQAGLRLFILKSFQDSELGDMKLEYTIQTPEINHTIISGMTSRIDEKFPDRFSMTKYAVNMMAAVHDNDAEQQLSMKEWARVLNKK